MIRRGDDTGCAPDRCVAACCPRGEGPFIAVQGVGMSLFGSQFRRWHQQGYVRACLLGVAASPLFPGVGQGQQSVSPLLLTTAREVHDLEPEMAPNARVHLEGTITYYDPLEHTMFLEDKSGGVYIDTDRAYGCESGRPGDGGWEGRVLFPDGCCSESGDPADLGRATKAGPADGLPATRDGVGWTASR